jgi:ferredoxin
MAITKVWIDESVDECTACGVCSDTAPEVFELGDKATVKAGADLNKNADLIEESADSCPVNVIAIEKDKSGKRDN